MIFIRLVGIILIVIAVIGITKRNDEMPPWYSKAFVIAFMFLFGLIFALGSSFRLEVDAPNGNKKEWKLEESKDEETIPPGASDEFIPEASSPTEVQPEETTEAPDGVGTAEGLTEPEEADGSEHIVLISGKEMTLPDIPGLKCTSYDRNLLVYHDDSYSTDIEYSDSFIDKGDTDAVLDWGRIYKETITTRDVSEVMTIQLNGRDSYYVVAESRGSEAGPVTGTVYLLQDIGMSHYLSVSITVPDYDGDVVELLETYSVNM